MMKDPSFIEFKNVSINHAYFDLYSEAEAIFDSDSAYEQLRKTLPSKVPNPWAFIGINSNVENNDNSFIREIKVQIERFKSDPLIFSKIERKTLQPKMNSMEESITEIEFYRNDCDVNFYRVNMIYKDFRAMTIKYNNSSYVSNDYSLISNFEAKLDSLRALIFKKVHNNSKIEHVFFEEAQKLYYGLIDAKDKTLVQLELLLKIKLHLDELEVSLLFNSSGE